MPDAATRRHVAELVDSCYALRDSTRLRTDLLRRLRQVLPVDAAFFATVDPLTLLFTSAVSEEPLIAAAPRFLDNEYGPADVNRFVDLTGDPVASLDRTTGGQRRASRRYTEIMAPLGLGDELRVVLRAGNRVWGVMCLHREDGQPGFSDSDLALVRRLAPHLAEGLRRAHVVDRPVTPLGGADTAGIIVLDADLQMVSINPAAEQWLAQIAEDDWPSSAELPVAVYAAAAALNAHSSDARSRLRPEARLRTAAGGWLVIHASHLDGVNGRQTAVVLDAPSPTQLASLFFAARSLTPAQERVAALVLQGHSTQQIVGELHISQHTVQEHLKAVFDKFGVRSRRDLVAALVLRH